MDAFSLHEHMDAFSHYKQMDAFSLIEQQEQLKLSSIFQLLSKKNGQSEPIRVLYKSYYRFLLAVESCDLSS